MCGYSVNSLSYSFLLCFLYCQIPLAMRFEACPPKHSCKTSKSQSAAGCALHGISDEIDWEYKTRCSGCFLAVSAIEKRAKKGQHWISSRLVIVVQTASGFAESHGFI